MGMFSLDENIDNYINASTIEELDALSAMISKRRAELIKGKRKNLAQKFQKAFNEYHEVNPYDMSFMVTISDEYGIHEHIVCVDSMELTLDNEIILKTSEKINLNA